MKKLFSFGHFTRPFLIGLALFALILRSLIPAGYMPDFSAQGIFLTICDGTQHHDHTHHHSDDTKHHTDICPFSVGTIISFDGIKAPDLLVLAFAVVAAASLLQMPPVRQMAFANASPRSPPSFC